MKKYNNYEITINGVLMEITYIDTRERVIDIVERTNISTIFGEEEVEIEKTITFNDFKNALRKVLHDKNTDLEIYISNYPKWKRVLKNCFEEKVYWNERNGC